MSDATDPDHERPGPPDGATRTGLRRDLLRYAALTVLAAAAWLGTGVFTIEALDKTRILPLWWVAGTAIPAGFVVFSMLRVARGDPRLQRSIALAATLGAALSLALAAPLNGLLIPASGEGALIWWVGLDEETSKLAAALLVSIGLAKSGRNGLRVGVAVGLGFAAWESAGYYFGGYLDGVDGIWDQVLYVLGRSVLDLGLHPLLTGLATAAVFSALGRRTAAAVVRAVAVFLVMAGVHSAYDWLEGQLPDDPGPFLLEPGDWLAVGVELALLVGVWVVLRSTRADRRGGARSESGAGAGTSGGGAGTSGGGAGASGTGAGASGGGASGGSASAGRITSADAASASPARSTDAVRRSQ